MRRTIWRGIVAAALVAVLAVVAAACKGGSGESEPYRIGVME